MRYLRWFILFAFMLLVVPGPAVMASAAPLIANVPVDCRAPRDFGESLWCETVRPDSQHELPAIVAAIDRIRIIGSVCAELARTLDAMLAEGRLHLFDPDALVDAGGLAPVGDGEHSYLLISREFLTRYRDAANASGNVDSRGVERPETLQLVLAHEADHLRGRRHIDRDGYLTPNTLRCSDVG